MSFTTTSPVLLVDGYNIIGAWPELKSLRDRDLEAARHQLVEVLINYTASQGYEAKVVFDAHLQATPKLCETPTKHLSVYYTAYGETADTFIEKFCAHNFRRGRIAGQRLIVATSDRAQQLTVSGYGAEWRSAQQLENDLRLAKHHTKRHSKNKTRSNRRFGEPSGQSRNRQQGRFLFNSLDAKAQEQLSKLRQGSS